MEMNMVGYGGQEHGHEHGQHRYGVAPASRRVGISIPS